MSAIKNILNYFITSKFKVLKQDIFRLQDIPQNLEEDTDVIASVLLRNQNELKQAPFNKSIKNAILKILISQRDTLLYRKLPKEFKEDIDIVKEVFSIQNNRRYKCVEFKEIPEKLRSNKELVLFLLNYTDIIKDEFTKPMFEDKEFLKKVIKNQPEMYKDLSIEWRADNDLIELGMKRGRNYSYIPEEEKSNIEYISSYIKEKNDSYYDMMKEIPKNLPYERKIYELMAEACPDQIKKFPSKYYNDKKIALIVVEANGLYISDLPSELKQDPDIINKALAENPLSVAYMPEILSNDKKMMDLIKSNEYVYKYASKEMRSNKILALKIVKRKPSLIEYVGENLKDDKDLFTIAVQKKGEYLEYAKKNGEVVNDKMIAEIAISNSNMAYVYLSKRLKEDEGLILKALSKETEVEKKLIFENLPKESLKSQEVKDLALKHNIGFFEYLTIEDKNNPKYASLALSKHAAYWTSVGEELKSDIDFKIKSILSNSDILNYLENDWQNDIDFLLKIEPSLEVQRGYFVEAYDLMVRAKRGNELRQTIDIDKKESKPRGRNKI